MRPWKASTLYVLLALMLLMSGTAVAQEANGIPPAVADTLSSAVPYVDFSSDRSTWFFSLDGAGDTVFCDFFSPFDPFTKVDFYDPIVPYQLAEPYAIDGEDVILPLSELEQLYDPFFAFAYVPAEGTEDAGSLYIRHVLYDKLEVDGFGNRSTRILYTLHTWDLTLSVQDCKASTGVSVHTSYAPVLSGRNLGEFSVDTSTAVSETAEFTLGASLEMRDGVWYAPAGALMSEMGKTAFVDAGYLHIQTNGLVDVTASMDKETRFALAKKYVNKLADDAWDNIDIPDAEAPKASNPWHCGWAETFDESYTWADYMNDVASGVRKTGWLWRSFYLSTGNEYVDVDGNPVSLIADRIVPFNLYVPHNYQPEETRMVLMLHGGTGNENTPTIRFMVLDEVARVKVDELADEYNYIMVSPNGWAQNPLWREQQGFASIQKAAEMAMYEFPVAEDKVFLMGNSLGGRGALEVGMRLADRFQAVVASAAKVTERVLVPFTHGEYENVCNIIDSTVYSVEKNLADKPVMMVQGTSDTTTSFRVQIGSHANPGTVAKYVMPYLNNATYIAVESGSHPHAFGAVLRAIFDFFEKQLKPDTQLHAFETLTVSATPSDTVQLDGQSYSLAVPTQVVDGTVMITLRDLEEIYGEDFRVYFVRNYNQTPVDVRYYYTVIHNRQAVNLMTEATANPRTDPTDSLRYYRVNMERYKEDMAKGDTDGSELLAKPMFSAAPFEADGEIFVPAMELLTALGEQVEVQ